MNSRLHGTIRRCFHGVCCAALAGAVLLAPPPMRTTMAGGQQVQPLGLSAEFPDALVHQTYSQTFVATGGMAPFRYSEAGELPQGMAWSGGAGGVVLSGMPVVAGVFPISVGVTDALGEKIVRTGTLTVDVFVHPHTNIPETLAENVATTDSVVAATAKNSTLVETITTTDTVTIVGPTPKNVAETITITDTISIFPVIQVSPLSVPAGTNHVGYTTQHFSASGGPGFAITLAESGTLPTGMSISAPAATLTLSGTPTQAGTFNFTITATDTVGNSGSRGYTLTIAQAAQTITVGTLPTPTYGNVSFTMQATSSSGLPVSYQVALGPVTGTNPFNITGAGGVTLVLTQAGNVNYAAAPNQIAVVTVQQAPLTVTAGSASRRYDQPNPASYGYTVTGYVLNENSGVITGAPTFATTAIGTSVLGSYPVTPNVGAMQASNYSLVPVNGTLTVTGNEAQAIFFTRPPNVTNGQSMVLTGLSTSGLNVAYGVTGPATVTNPFFGPPVLTTTGVGTVTVTASQAGDSNYAAAAAVVRSFQSQ